MNRKSKKEQSGDGAAQAQMLIASAEALIADADLPAAIAQLQSALALDPASDAGHYALGCAWVEAGEAERAVDILSKLSASPEWAARANAKISAAEEMASANRSPASYVRHLFDQFAPDYDKRMLDELCYRAPSILRGLADMVVGAEPATLDILDLGCGTGLAGKAFQDLARRLDGVDLSPGMIAQAQRCGIYHELAEADAEILLGEEGPCYDLIVAADMLVYLGDLRPIFRGVAGRLNASGFFLFTVEKSHRDEYERGPKRRYRHAQSYVRDEAARAGLEVMGLMDCSPRDDAGVPVEGFAVALQHV